MSDFENTQSAIEETSGEFSFSNAERLERSGGSCDCYKARLHRRKVFIKRLKPELRFHPRYVGAFDKEYDLGVDLSHPALPAYREFHDDYIVMDYIDGKTLAELIAENDPWLRNDANIRKVIESLIDVVDYLHQRDVVHCDIKADNVMITNGNRTLKLIDLGNAYTDWFTDTSGNPANYGLSPEQTGKPEMDFRGIGNILKCLSEAGFGNKKKLTKFRELCYHPGVTADILRTSITKPTVAQHNNLARTAILTVSVTTLCLCAAILYISRSSTKEIPVSQKRNTVTVQPIATKAEPHNTAAPPTAVPANRHGESSLKQANVAQQYEEIINSEMRAIVKPMLNELDKAEALANEPAASVAALRKALYDLVNKYTSTSEQSYSIFKKRFPDVGAVAIELAVANSPEYQTMLQRYTKVSQKITDRIFEIQDK